MLKKEAKKKADETTDLFRFVSEGELLDIKKTGKFKIKPRQFEAKQFGLDLDEIKKLSKEITKKKGSPIVSVTVPKKTLKKLDLLNVDPQTLKKGSVTARIGEQLDTLNESIIGTIERVQ